MTDREVMQMALETAEQIACADYRHWEELASLSEFERWARSRANHIAEALRTALAQPEPEPVGRFAKFSDGIWKEVTDGSAGQPLYTAPPQRKEWAGLTDEEKHRLNDALNLQGRFPIIDAIEAKLKEKNT